LEKSGHIFYWRSQEGQKNVVDIIKINIRRKYRMIQKQSRISKLPILSIIAILTFAVLQSGNWSDNFSAFAMPAQGSLRDDANDQGCTNSSLQGTYGFTAQGFTLKGAPLPAPLQGPFASSGSATFDGQGNFTLTATSSFNGLVQGPTTVKGTYSVNKDCTYDSMAENGATFRSVIVNGGKEILILQTTPGVAITGTAKRL
jgi:hypothetical protein